MADLPSGDGDETKRAGIHSRLVCSRADVGSRCELQKTVESAGSRDHNADGKQLSVGKDLVMQRFKGAWWVIVAVVAMLPVGYTPDRLGRPRPLLIFATTG
jgi:hypothetical protein